MKDLAPSPGQELSVATAIEWSVSASLAVTFSKSTSSGYLPAVSAARRAQRYAEQIVGRKMFHAASFGTSQEQIALALFVIEQMQRSTTFQIFASGKLIRDKWRIADTLNCVLTATGTSDPRSHCVISVEEDRLDNRNNNSWPMTIHVSYEPPIADTFGLYKVGMRLFPCRLLFERGFKFQINHPSSEADQIRAGAVRESCDWCPHLRPDD
jgi:hypothetical protein